MTYPGGFRAEWSVWCAAQISRKVKASDDCPTRELVAGGRHAQRAKQARAKGWRMHTGVGWLCPACSKTYTAVRVARLAARG